MRWIGSRTSSLKSSEGGCAWADASGRGRVPSFVVSFCDLAKGGGSGMSGAGARVIGVLPTGGAADGALRADRAASTVVWRRGRPLAEPPGGVRVNPGSAESSARTGTDRVLCIGFPSKKPAEGPVAVLARVSNWGNAFVGMRRRLVAYAQDAIRAASRRWACARCRLDGAAAVPRMRGSPSSLRGGAPATFRTRPLPVAPFAASTPEGGRWQRSTGRS